MDGRLIYHLSLSAEPKTTPRIAQHTKFKARAATVMRSHVEWVGEKCARMHEKQLRDAQRAVTKMHKPSRTL